MTYEDLVKMLHGVHNSISPGANTGTLMSLLGRGGLGAARAGMGASQGDILNDPATIARISSKFAPGGPAVAPGPSNPTAQPISPPSGAYPNEMVSQGFNALGPSPLQTAMATPAPLPAPPALSAQAMAPQAGPLPAPAPPMPAPRPPEAPQAPPDMGFFARNAAMMRDPSSGAFIDPTNADRAQASGPDVINKLLSYFHQKDTA